MNKNASDDFLQYLEKDDSLAFKEFTQKLRDEEINISRETVRIKINQKGYLSKTTVKNNELSLQQKEVRLKWCKKYKKKRRLGQCILYKRKKRLKGNKKMIRWIRRKDKKLNSLLRYSQKINVWGTIKRC